MRESCNEGFCVGGKVDWCSTETGSEGKRTGSEGMVAVTGSTVGRAAVAVGSWRGTAAGDMTEGQQVVQQEWLGEVCGETVAGQQGPESERRLEDRG